VRGTAAVGRACTGQPARTIGEEFGQQVAGYEWFFCLWVCLVLRLAGRWGSQAFICACVSVACRPNADPMRVCGRGRLQLSYHRHAYSLGEHYNSVVDAS
jgi:hypothetical protein